MLCTVLHWEKAEFAGVLFLAFILKGGGAQPKQAAAAAASLEGGIFWGWAGVLSTTYSMFHAVAVGKGSFV